MDGCGAGPVDLVRLWSCEEDKHLLKLAISAKDQAGLLFRLCELLLKHTIDIVSADLRLDEGMFRADVLLRNPDNDSTLLSARKLGRDLDHFLTECQGAEPPKPEDLRTMERVSPDLFAVSAFYELPCPDGKPGEQRYMLEVEGINQAGLLAYLSSVFFQCGFNIIHTAINTAETMLNESMVLSFTLSTLSARAPKVLHTHLDITTPNANYRRSQTDNFVEATFSQRSQTFIDEGSWMFPSSPEASGKHKDEALIEHELIHLENGDVYDGQCVQVAGGVKQHGYGTYRYSGQATSYREYVGNWDHGKKEGHGVLFLQSGGVYVGQWHSNQRHGLGIWFDYGDTQQAACGMPSYSYEGEWHQDQKSGFGIEEAADHIYFGIFEGGRPSGRGIRVSFDAHLRIKGCEALDGRSWKPLLDALEDEALKLQRLAAEEAACVGDVGSPCSAPRHGISAPTQRILRETSQTMERMPTSPMGSVVQKGPAVPTLSRKSTEFGSFEVANDENAQNPNGSASTSTPRDSEANSPQMAPEVAQPAAAPWLESPTTHRLPQLPAFAPPRRQASTMWMDSPKQLAGYRNAEGLGWAFNAAGGETALATLTSAAMQRTGPASPWRAVASPFAASPRRAAPRQMPSALGAASPKATSMGLCHSAPATPLGRPGEEDFEFVLVEGDDLCSLGAPDAIAQEQVARRASSPLAQRMASDADADEMCRAASLVGRCGSACVSPRAGSPRARQGAERRAMTPERSLHAGRPILCPMLWSEVELAAFISCLGLGKEVTQSIQAKSLRGVNQLVQMSNVELSRLFGLKSHAQRRLVRRALMRFLELDRWQNAAKQRRLPDLMVDPSLREFLIHVDELTVGPEISQGGFGQVFRGVLRPRVSRGRLLAGREYRVAIKDMKGDRSLRLRELLKESRVMASLHHRNMCTFLGVVGERCRATIVSELMDCSLFDLVHQSADLNWKGDLSLPVIFELARGICAGISYLHSKKLVHADLKSSNILVDFSTCNRLVPKICDFGHVAVRTHPAPHDRCGTPQWAAPEALRNEAVGPAADVFSVGVMLWEMCARALPHHGLTFAQVVGAVGYGSWTPDMDLLPEVPDALRDLLCRCWRFVAEERPSITEVRAELRQMLRAPRREALTALLSFCGA